VWAGAEGVHSGGSGGEEGEGGAGGWVVVCAGAVLVFARPASTTRAGTRACGARATLEGWVGRTPPPTPHLSPAPRYAACPPPTPLFRTQLLEESSAFRASTDRPRRAAMRAPDMHAHPLPARRRADDSSHRACRTPLPPPSLLPPLPRAAAGEVSCVRGCGPGARAGGCGGARAQRRQPAGACGRGGWGRGGGAVCAVGAVAVGGCRGAPTLRAPVGGGIGVGRVVWWWGGGMRQPARHVDGFEHVP
jgi:hypothetical protein